MMTRSSAKFWRARKFAVLWGLDAGRVLGLLQGYGTR
jgi:hypothetical protein